MPDLKINSKNYWDKRFDTNWELYLGREQTAYFYKLALHLMPDWLIDEIKSNKLSICDAGCAEGDGTRILANFFSRSNVIGVDFSESAIMKAKKYYPENDFICGTIEDLEGKYDVVFSSNTLEHFHDPYPIVKNMIKNTKKFFILLLPFQEQNPIPEHFSTFDYNSFPLVIGDFNIVFSYEIDCKDMDNTHWSGKQIMVIYANSKEFDLNSLGLDSILNNVTEFEKRSIHLSDRLKSREEQIKKIENEVSLLVNQLNLKDEISSFIDQLRSKDEQLYYLLRQIETKDNKIEALSEKLKEIEGQLLESVSQLRNKAEQLSLKNEEIFSINQKLQTSETQIWELKGQLHHIHSSNFWAIASKYYRIRDSFVPFKYLYKTLKILKREGYKAVIHQARQKILTISEQKKVGHSEKTLDIINIYKEIVSRYNQGNVKGIAVITSAFEFEELYNQRTINLAKYLSDQDYAVLFVCWQWDKNEILNKAYKEVYSNVFELPMYPFIDNINELELFFSFKEKFAILTFPSEIFYKWIPSLRIDNFLITYDILDEWEEFNKVGQAPWFDREVEEGIILNSDFVVAVSEPLVKKFSFLRNDIKCIGNGYSPTLLKEEKVSLRSEAKDKRIHIGYFGHLTDSWFDWDLLLYLADVSKKFCFHIIGYGYPDYLLKKIKQRENIKLYGKVEPSQLYQHVKNWHIGIIPFKKSNLSEAVDPIKIYEYLYFGLPSVVTGISHIKRYPYVEYCENKEDVFEKLVNLYQLLISDGLNDELIRTFSENTTWDVRFSEMVNESKKSNYIQRIFHNE